MDLLLVNPQIPPYPGCAGRPTAATGERLRWARRSGSARTNGP
jgi:hypothetical protein